MPTPDLPPEIEVRIWPLKVMVRGTDAISAMWWPLAAILTAIAIAIIVGVVTEIVSLAISPG